ncbi:MAG: 23S rRNA (adenine(2030)-N(6))-methyltransferase RlmJ [Pseudomonadota bacterium]
MLSYQHAYHAGNLADVHKHSMLSWVLSYLTNKDKPLSYIETHGGRGHYDLAGVEAQKTGEAAQGITRAKDWFASDHPYRRVLTCVATRYGSAAYPGSPLIAHTLLRREDAIDVAELHPAEYEALRQVLPRGSCHRQDGFERAHSLIPPTPRRGLILIDPSFEVKSDYDVIPGHIRKWHKAWNVGIIILWYPILTSRAHAPMTSTLRRDHPEAMHHEVRFPPARPGHGMVGSGMFVVNPPYGLSEEAARLKQHFDGL